MTENTLLTKKILSLLLQGYSQKEIAVNLRKHRNTIYSHIKKIKQQQLFTVKETVNKIDLKLNQDILQMKHNDLIYYRRTLMPPVTKMETKTTVEGGKIPLIVKMWKPEEDESTGNNDKVLASPKTGSVS